MSNDFLFLYIGELNEVNKKLSKMVRKNAYKFLMVFIVMFAFVNIYLQELFLRIDNILDRMDKLSSSSGVISSKIDNLLSVMARGLSKTNLHQTITHEQKTQIETKADEASFDEYLIKHPLFSKFNLTISPNKTRVNLVVIITSAPKRSDRRQAIRDTWWQQCKSNDRVS